MKLIFEFNDSFCLFIPMEAKPIRNLIVDGNDINFERFRTLDNLNFNLTNVTESCWLCFSHQKDLLVKI